MQDTKAAQPSPWPETGCVIVAGGSGGLGRGICLSFAKRGASVAVLYRTREARAQQLVEKLQAEGAQALACRVDLELPETIDDAVKAASERFGFIHTAVYSAGPSIRIDYLSKISSVEFRDVLGADAIGCFNFIQSVLPALRLRGGSLIGITTEQLERIELRGALSSVPKAAVDKLFEVVAKEEARNGIRAATVRAGWVDAGLGGEALADALPADVVKSTIASIPLRRFGLPSEIGDTVVFLASPGAGYITGVSIPVNGGRHL